MKILAITYRFPDFDSLLGNLGYASEYAYLFSFGFRWCSLCISTQWWMTRLSWCRWLYQDVRRSPIMMINRGAQHRVTVLLSACAEVQFFRAERCGYSASLWPTPSHAVKSVCLSYRCKQNVWEKNI